MRVLVVPSWYPTPSRPVNGNFVREYVAALGTQMDARVLHIDVLPRGERRKPQRRVTRARGFVEERVEVRNLPGLWQLAYLLAMRRELRRVRREFAPDILNAHIGVPAGWAAVLLKRVAGAPVVLTEHSSEFTYWMHRPGLRWMARTAFRWASVVVAVSEGQRRRIVDTFGRQKRLVVIPNVVDTERFAATPLPDTSTGYRMLLVGLMDTDQKGVHVLIEALDLVRRHGKLDRPLNVTIAGDGVLRPQYEEKAHSIGLGRMVRFVGMRKPDEIARLLTESHALVMPSLHEAAPVALIEALVSGRPAIVTACGGPDYMVDEANGVVVEPGNAEELATAIEEMMPNLYRYDSVEIASRAKAKYSREAVTARVVALFERVARH